MELLKEKVQEDGFLTAKGPGNDGDGRRWRSLARGMYHGKNVVYLNIDVTIIVRRVYKIALKYALSHPSGFGDGAKVNYGKFRNLPDDWENNHRQLMGLK